MTTTRRSGHPSFAAQPDKKSLLSPWRTGRGRTGGGGCRPPDQLSPCISKILCIAKVDMYWKNKKFKNQKKKTLRKYVKKNIKTIVNQHNKMYRTKRRRKITRGSFKT